MDGNTPNRAHHCHRCHRRRGCSSLSVEGELEQGGEGKLIKHSRRQNPRSSILDTLVVVIVGGGGGGGGGGGWLASRCKKYDQIYLKSWGRRALFRRS